MVAMKFIISIIFMFLSAQVFSNSPAGKGLACDIKVIQDDMKILDVEKMFFWFNTENFLTFYLEDINGTVDFSNQYKSLNDLKSKLLRTYTYDKDFIKHSGKSDNEFRFQSSEITINRKTLEMQLDELTDFENKSIKRRPEKYIRKFSGKCKVLIEE